MWLPSVARLFFAEARATSAAAEWKAVKWEVVGFAKSFIIYLQLERSDRLSSTGLRGTMQTSASEIKHVDPCDRSGSHIQLVDAHAVASIVAAVSIDELAAIALRHR